MSLFQPFRNAIRKGFSCVYLIICLTLIAVISCQYGLRMTTNILSLSLSKEGNVYYLAPETCELTRQPRDTNRGTTWSRTKSRQKGHKTAKIMMMRSCLRFILKWLIFLLVFYKCLANISIFCIYRSVASAELPSFSNIFYYWLSSVEFFGGNPFY